MHTCDDIIILLIFPRFVLGFTNTNEKKIFFRKKKKVCNITNNNNILVNVHYFYVPVDSVVSKYIFELFQ